MTSNGDRYRWGFKVIDAFERPAVARYGVENGQLIYDGPTWWKTVAGQDALTAAAMSRYLDEASDELGEGT